MLTYGHKTTFYGARGNQNGGQEVVHPRGVGADVAGWMQPLIFKKAMTSG